jgi:hypothetical protein
VFAAFGVNDDIPIWMGGRIMEIAEAIGLEDRFRVAEAEEFLARVVENGHDVCHLVTILDLATHGNEVRIYQHWVEKGVRLFPLPRSFHWGLMSRTVG